MYFLTRLVEVASIMESKGFNLLDFNGCDLYAESTFVHKFLAVVVAVSILEDNKVNITTYEDEALEDDKGNTTTYEDQDLKGGKVNITTYGDEDLEEELDNYLDVQIRNWGQDSRRL